MDTSLYPRRFALLAVGLLFSVVLLAPESNAKASNITYNLVNFPANQADLAIGGVDHITGDIVTDGTFGTYTYPTSHIISTSLSITNSAGQTFSVSSPICEGTGNFLTASATGLLVGSGEGLTISGQLEGFGSDVSLYVEWFPGTYGSDFYGAGIDNSDSQGPVPPYITSVSQPGAIMFSNSQPTGQLLLGGQAAPWTIATVPEPTSLTLLGSALLGLGVVYLRHRRAKA